MKLQFTLRKLRFSPGFRPLTRCPAGRDSTIVREDRFGYATNTGAFHDRPEIPGTNPIAAIQGGKVLRRVRNTLPATILMLLVCGLVTSASGQQGAKPEARASAPKTAARRKAKPVIAAKPGEFNDQELDLHFHYPIEMRALDASAERKRGHQDVSGVSGANDAEQVEAKRCERPLLEAELPEDRGPQRVANLDGVWTDESKEYKESRKPEPVSAKILMIEIVRVCLPAELQKNENDALGSIAMSFVSQPGIKRMLEPLWYELGNQKIHVNSGAGRPIVNGNLASAPVLIMSMTTQWRGHLLAWVFTSNDIQIFNEITKSLVQFGDGEWGQMFAANVGPKGSGTRLTRPK